MAVLRQNILRRMTSAAKNAKPWLCFTAEQSNSTVRLDIIGSPDPVSIKTSRDGKTWSAYSWNGSTGAIITLANIGDKVYWRSTVTDDTGTFSNTGADYYKYIMNGTISASGSVQSLLRKDGKRKSVPTRGFTNLFNSCSSLVSAPELPATTLGGNCYTRMFYRCTSLVSALELPATTLDSQCYNQMFNGCNSLNRVKTAMTEWSNYTSMWLNNVSNTGTFICPDELEEIRDEGHIPEGWTLIKPSDGYVQSGLIFQLDIKRNIAAGEYGASTWTDVKQGKQFTEDFPEYVGDLLEYATANGYTVEIVIGCGYNSQEGYYHGTGWFITEPEGYVDASIELSTIIIEGMIMPNFDAKINGHRVQFYQDGTDYSVVTISNYSLSDKVYINNVEYTGTAYSRTVGTDPKTRVGNPEYIKEVRIYNRQLTAEERLHNHQLDQERFNV